MELLENLPEPLELVAWVTRALPGDLVASVVDTGSSGLIVVSRGSSSTKFTVVVTPMSYSAVVV